MTKHFLSIKKIKKQILSINNSIESYFNKLKYFKSNYKKILLSRDYRVFLGFGIVALLTLVYFLIPTFYNKNYIKSEIKNQILKNYNIELNINEEIKYGLLPKPHFYTKNLSIIRNKKEIASTGILKVFIEIDKFLSLNKIYIKDLVFYKSDFNINYEDIPFFQALLKVEPNENNIYFKKSNLFFRNNNDELLFINKVDDSKFYYDSKNLKNIFFAKNEIFNVPFKLTIKNDKFDKKFYTNFISKKIRLNIENETSYDDEIKKGLLDILFVNKTTALNYEIKNESLNYFSNNNSYKGKIEFKPFYFSAEFNYNGISFKDLFNNDSILMDLIESEIFNNKNLNLDLVFNIRDIINIDELNNLVLKIGVEQGNISPSDSSIMWKDDLKIQLTDSLIIFDRDDTYLTGNILIDIIDIDNFHKSFQVKKINRKKIKKIEFDFNYNLNKKKITFDNFQIDENKNSNVEKFINKINLQEKIIFNKITFKNFIGSFFAAYAG